MIKSSNEHRVQECLGVGVDIESISRFKDMHENKKLLNSLFTRKEIDYCLGKMPVGQHFAARFAAKEAVKKAFGSIGKNIFYNDIEILNRSNKSPYVKLSKFNEYHVLISLSHNKENALAFALLVK